MNEWTTKTKKKMIKKHEMELIKHCKYKSSTLTDDLTDERYGIY